MKNKNHYYSVIFLLAAGFAFGCKKETAVQHQVQASVVSLSTAGLSRAGMLMNTKEINYYPAKNGWTYMWTNWKPATIDADLAKIAAQGFNTVRIITQVVPGAFDYPQPTTDELKKLETVICLAQKNKLKVHLTLFDFWNNYTDHTGSQQWINAVVKPFAGDQRVSIIELQNEINPADTAAMHWASFAITYIKSISKGIPVTISEYGVDRMQKLVNSLAASPPDFYSYHVYNNNGLLYSDLSSVKAMVGSIPLFIGESGYSTYAQNQSSPGGLAQNTISQEAFQEYLYRNLVNATRSLALPLPSPWIYSDFDTNAIPYVTTPDQYYFGIYRLDGTAKPVLATYKSLLSGAAVNETFNNGFEQGDGQLPVLWRIYQNAAAGFTANFARDARVAHTGYASAAISNSTQSTSGQASFYLNPVLLTTPRKNYTLTAWVKGAAVTGSNGLSIAWFDKTGAYLTQNFSPNAPTGVYDWTQLSVSGVAPANAAMYEIHLNSQANTGTIWFDDVAVK